MSLFQDKLSQVYHSLFPLSVLEMEIPNERFADCMDCFHCHSDARATKNIKCCSYHPILPNYMVGAILSDHSPAMAEGRKRIIEKIKNRIGVTPYGIIPPLAHRQLFQKQAKKTKREIARTKEIADALQCPYQSEDSLCTIWKYRIELCSTFHCASVGGQKGHRFWGVAFQYLTSMEQKLTLFALQAEGYPTAAIRTQRLNPVTLQLDNLKGELNEVLYKKMWKQWEGKETKFYENCYQHIQHVSRDKVAELTGIEETVKMSQLAERSEAILQQQIPHFLKIDTKHPSYQEISKKNQLTLSNGKVLKINQIHFTILKGFNGTTPTLHLIKKSYTVNQGIVHLILPLMKEGLFKRM